MNICFVTDPWENLKPETDSTLRLISEAVTRGHTVALLNPRTLTVRGNIMYGLFDKFEKVEKPFDRIATFYAKSKFKTQRLPVKGFEVMVLRKDPPLDWTMLNFLDSIKDDTWIINDVDGLRSCSTKLYLTTFEDSHEFIPDTHVSKDIDYLYNAIEESKSEKLILKPLDGFGGSGVILLEKSAMTNVRSLLDFYIGGSDQKNYVIIQEFVEGAEEGDVRIFMLNGEPLGAMKRVPAKGDIRSNVHAGGQVEKHSLTKKEKEICRIVGPKLIADGLHMAGLDLIKGKLIEINVVSPGGIVNINRLNKVRIDKKILDFIEYRYQKRESAFMRKQEFKREVSEVSLTDGEKKIH